MHPIRTARKWLLMGLVGIVTSAGVSPAVAQQPAPAPEPAATDRSGSIIVPVQGAVRFQMKSKKNIKEAFASNQNVLRVEADAANPGFVILRGATQGASRLELTDKDGAKEVYEVVVQTDIELLRNILRRAVPTANVDVIPFGNSAIISGNVARNEDVQTILQIAATVLGGQNIVNALTVGGVSQVQLDVTIARVDRSKIRNIGFNFAVTGTTGSFSSVLGGLTTNNAGVITGTSAANLSFGLVPSGFNGFLQALKVENCAKTLAEPKLVTQSGRPAHFLAGGQQATLGPSSGINGPGVVYQDIGTQLEFLPIVYGNGKIYLEVSPTVRGVNQGLGITSSFGTVPGFDTQEVRTSVVLEPGQTFAIGGLIQNSTQSSVTRVPVLGELPFIGPFFSVASHQDQEVELLILVTPHLVDPMDCNQVPRRLPGRETRSPDDFEFYLETMLELPRGQRNVFEGRRYKAGYLNSPTVAQFPCGWANPGPGIGLGAGLHGGAANCANGSCGTPTTLVPPVAGVPVSSAKPTSPVEAAAKATTPAEPTPTTETNFGSLLTPPPAMPTSRQR